MSRTVCVVVLLYRPRVSGSVTTAAQGTPTALARDNVVSR
jgi:hypothetical protein